VSPNEFSCTVSPASDWRFWFRVVLVRQAITVVFVLIGFILAIPILPVVLFAISCLSFGQRVTVDARGLGARWLFVTKLVPIGAILKASYSRPRGFLNVQVLHLELSGKPTMELRADAANLRAIGHALALHGRAPTGAVHDRANRGTAWKPLLLVVAAVLGSLFGYAVQRLR